MEGLGTMNVRIGKKHLLGQYTIVLKHGRIKILPQFTISS